MTTTPERPDYTPEERLNVGHEDIAESGFALVSHIDDPSFIVAVRPRKTPVEDAWEYASRDASLGVGHIWTAVRCPAYRSLDPADCTCQGVQ